MRACVEGLDAWSDFYELVPILPAFVGYKLPSQHRWVTGTAKSTGSSGSRMPCCLQRSDAALLLVPLFTPIFSQIVGATPLPVTGPPWSLNPTLKDTPRPERRGVSLKINSSYTYTSSTALFPFCHVSGP